MIVYGHHIGSWITTLLAIVFIAASGCEATISIGNSTPLFVAILTIATRWSLADIGRNVASELLHVDNITDSSIMTLFIFIGYSFQYVGNPSRP
jgi:hypothetical protein